MNKSAFVIIALLINLATHAQTYKTIEITHWVNQPDEKLLEKPLLFVDFWATWCIPCIHAMPQTDRLKKEFKDDVLFMYLSDETSEKVRLFMERFNKQFYSAVDNSGMTHSKFSVQAIPYAVLLDNYGRLIWEGQPVELKRETLQRYVSMYKNKTGLKNRIEVIKQIYQKDDWIVIDDNDVSLMYLEKELISNKFSVDNNEYYISGSIDHIISIIYNTSMSNIVSDQKIDKEYIIKCNADDYSLFVEALKKFIKNECKINVIQKEEEVEAYILDGNNDETFLSTCTYDFEKGNNSFLAGDMNVTIDNATTEEMTNVLTDFSEKRFMYKGDLKGRYDWKIHYKFINLTLEQLENELNFHITKETVKHSFLKLSLRGIDQNKKR